MPHKRTDPKTFYGAKELRRAMTPAERKLWARLRNHQLNGLGFRRQHAVGKFILDFCCPRAKYVVELDGHSHASQVEYDTESTAWLEAQGWRVRRFANADVEKNLEGVLTVIARECADRQESTPPQPSPSEEH